MPWVEIDVLGFVLGTFITFINLLIKIKVFALFFFSRLRNGL